MTNNVCNPRYTDSTEQMNRVFGNLFNKPVKELIKEGQTQRSPVYANIEELTDRFNIYLTIPGYDKSEVTITQEKNKLTIRGKNEGNSEKKFKIREFDFTGFERSFFLPQDVQYDRIEASAENGILKVVILKAEVKPPHVITIK